MIEYIYNIIRILSNFEFKIWDYAKDGGMQATHAAQEYYCDKCNKEVISDIEVKEISRFVRYKYIDKCKNSLRREMIEIIGGLQELKIDIDDIQVIIMADVKSDSIKLVLESPFHSCVAIYSDNPNASFLIRTVMGYSLSEIGKERLAIGVADLLMKN
jgi:hypothetical protein